MVIDMTFATIALYAKGVTRLYNISSWRVKETDRILAIVNGLKKLGAEVEFGENWLEINPPKKLKDSSIDTCDDHRIAMSFAIAGLISQHSLTIMNTQNISTSFPTFVTTLRELGVEVFEV